VVPDIYKVFNAPHFYASIFSWRYLRCYCRYLDNSMRDILQTWCQIQRTSYQCTLCELWSRPYTKYLQLLIVRPQYSTERICAAIGDIPTLRCALYCKFGDKYSAHRPVYAMWPVVPDIYKVFTVPHNQASVFNRSYLRIHRRYIDNSMGLILQMRLILQIWWQIQRTSSGLRNVNWDPGHIQSIYSSS
jgi:hypothetical protein